MGGGDEYASVGGGSLKLKGVKGSKVDKQKKRKHKRADHSGDGSGSQSVAARSEKEKEKDARERKLDVGGEGYDDDEGGDDTGLDRRGGRRTADEADSETAPDTKSTAVPKTAAELRYEERRRKLLNERLRREGTKTHKERVEGLNKYLSGLSEHHDMPRIGPG